MEPTNIILGYGETLTAPHKLTRGPSSKAYPNDISEQRTWLGEQLASFGSHAIRVPALARPRGLNVAKLTLHPAFLAKSYHPNTLFAASGLRCVGSRSTSVLPRHPSTKPKKGKEQEPVFTAMLFVAGDDAAFGRLGTLLRSQATPFVHKQALCRIELIQTFTGQDKNLVRTNDEEAKALEVVLHASRTDGDIVSAFKQFVDSLGGQADIGRALVVSGLTFVPVTLPPAKVAELGEFQLVRAIRLMPALRIGATEFRSIGAPTAPLPTLPALDPNLKVAVFDGGIGHADLAPWVTETILAGTETTSAGCLSHGNAVTSAVLFGPIDPAAPSFPRPYAPVQHYRCVSPSLTAPGGVGDPDLYDVLKHIDATLKSQQFDFINLSLGPRLPMEDDEVHPWTAVLDQHLSSGNTLAVVAAGNDGRKTWPDSRIQPPADMVNALAVGACDSQSDLWQRAPYSSYGPGRSPGLVKPDGVAFGGVTDNPFVVLANGQLNAVTGTSFSSPYVLHTAIGVKASLTSPLSMLAVRALMNHHCARADAHAMHEVGYGRFPQRVEEVLHCGDNEVRVIYQGTLSAGQNLRASIPFPTLPLQGRVTLRATLVFASQTDPEHAVNYTRAGLTVTLRPNGADNKTMAFFSASKMYTSELEARSGEQKWETTLKHEKRFNASTLNNPIFDITYGAREEGQAVDNSTLMPLRYAMVVTVAVENTPGIYNNIRQRYQTLQPVQVRQEVRLQTGSGRP
jgi:hypothetical protein